DQLKRDVEMTSALARAFMLKKLSNEIVALRALPDQKDGGRIDAVIEGDGRTKIDGKERGVVMRLWVDRATSQLVAARVTIEGDDPLQIVFSGQEREKGVEIPRKIEIFRLDPRRPDRPGEKPELTLFVEELDLAPTLKDEDFAPPKQK